jgi:hypothetical protein
MSTVSGITTVTSTVVQFVGPNVQVGSATGTIGFYGKDPIAKQTGVAVTAAGVHAALVALGLIAA